MNLEVRLWLMTKYGFNSIVQKRRDRIPAPEVLPWLDHFSGWTGVAVQPTPKPGK
jgi:hypothetical protein